jgi:dTDP-4-dehydrorhamnose 3,5-epimerase
MKFTETEIKGCFILEADLFKDDRGYFFVPYNKDLIGSDSRGYLTRFMQDNESYSQLGTIRGLHYQKKDYAQSKLVRCIYGKVLDVIVDIRPNSESYKKVLTFELDEPNRMIFIPKGCAHGFSVMSEFAIFSYKVDRPYNKDYEGGIRYDDPTLNIDWGIPKGSEIVSEKDRSLSLFSEK